MVQRWLLGVIGVSCLASSSLALTVRLDQQAVVVDGVKPSGRVLVLGGTHERPGPYVLFTTIKEVLTDSDGDGVVTLDLNRPMPRFSTWLAVDLASGATASVTGDKVVPTAEPIDKDQLVDGETAATGLRVPTGNMCLAALVRPSLGVWTATLNDGGSGDSDGEPDGKINMQIRDLEPAGSSAAAPATGLPGDLLAVIDIRTLKLTMVKL